VNEASPGRDLANAVERDRVQIRSGAQRLQRVLANRRAVVRQFVAAPRSHFPDLFPRPLGVRRNLGARLFERIEIQELSPDPGLPMASWPVRYEGDM
jgi:hypothetical protein